MNIETDFPREHSTSLSFDSFIEMFVNFAVSFMNYVDYIQVQANNIT